MSEVLVGAASEGDTPTGAQRASHAPLARAPAGPSYAVVLPARRLTLGLLMVTLLLLGSHAVLAIVHFEVEALPWLLRQLFDLDEENNLPTWFAQFLLIICSALVGVHALAMRDREDRFARHWMALSLGFLLMAVDEVSGVHETINSIIDVTWAIPAALVCLAVGSVFVPFLWSLPRRVASGFCLAGLIFLAGALGVEIFGNELMRNDEGDTLRYYMATLVEEGLEMLGLVLFIHVMSSYMREARADSVRASLHLT